MDSEGEGDEGRKKMSGKKKVGREMEERGRLGKESLEM